MSINTSCVDLFCGIGGLTHGLTKAGINVKAGLDFDLSCKWAYEQNNNAQFIYADIKTIEPTLLENLFEKDSIKVLVGCAPCQPFSNYSNSNKSRFQDDKWSLLQHFEQFIMDIKPEIVSMENVPQLAKHSIFRKFIQALETNGYYLNAEIVNTTDFGVPQRRKRLVLLASRLGQIKLIRSEKNEMYTLEDVIGNLSEIKAGGVDKADPLHRAPKLSELNLKRVKNSLPGGSWEDWEPELKLKCHQKASGQTYKSVYGRLRFNEPSPTITTQFYNIGTGRFIHPTQHRALSLREGALIQTFPLNYKIINPEIPFSFRKYGLHIGNAVPVKLGEEIGNSIIRHLEEYSVKV